MYNKDYIGLRTSMIDHHFNIVHENVEQLVLVYEKQSFENC